MKNIEKLIKKGQLDLAISELEVYAKSVGADDETLSDILVLNGNLSNLKRQEKRRVINADKVRDALTSYGYEITDIIKKLEQEHASKMVAPNVSNPDIIAETGKISESGAAVIQSNININIDISNHISNEIKIDIQGMKQGFEELKNSLSKQDDDPAHEAVKKIEDLSTNIEQLENATDKNKLPGLLKGVQDFFKNLEDGNDKVSKAISVTKNGIQVIRKIAKNYNNIAQWVGLPIVPTLFTCSSSDPI